MREERKNELREMVERLKNESADGLSTLHDLLHEKVYFKLANNEKLENVTDDEIRVFMQFEGFTHSNEKIRMIKHLRQVTRCSLLDAKWTIEQVFPVGICPCCGSHQVKIPKVWQQVSRNISVVLQFLKRNLFI